MKNKQNWEISVISAEKEWYSMESASSLTDVHIDLIREYLKGGLVNSQAADESGNPLFDEVALCRLRLLRDLREREKLSLRMMRIVCVLTDRLERAELEIERLRNRQR